MNDGLIDLSLVLPKTIETLVVSVLGLYIVVNPAGVASVFLGLTREMSGRERRSTAWRATIIAAVILTLFALVGTYIMRRIHITAGALQIAGGIFIFGLAYALARGKESEFFGRPGTAPGPTKRHHGIALSPLAVPMMAGPASIVVVTTASGKAGDDPYAWAALLIAIVVTCLLCVMTMLRWVSIEEKYGPGFAAVAPRIMGLVLAVIAVQFIIDGVAQVLPHLARALQETT